MIPFVDVVYDGDDYEFEISLEPKDPCCFGFKVVYHNGSFLLLQNIESIDIPFFLNITIMSRNLLHLPTSVNSYQDTVSHILVVHQWQVCLMHNLIRVWFSNSFLLPSSQCEAYSLHWYKHQ